MTIVKPTTYVSESPSVRVGVCVPDLADSTNAEVDAALDRCVALGLGHVRADLGWRWTEATQGSPTWGHWDYFMAATKQRGLTVLPVMQTTPTWSTGNAGSDIEGTRTPAQWGHYADFAKRFVLRYPGQVSAFEVHNEVNLDQFWLMPDPIAYVGLLKETYTQLKQANPGITVISAGLGGAYSQYDQHHLKFLRAMYEAGMSGHCDAVGYHPYTNDRNVTGLLADSRKFRAIMDEYGDGDKQIWATEAGIPTSGTSGQNYITEAQQADYVDTVLRYWRQDVQLAGPLYWYALDDSPVRQPDREGYFGVHRSDGTAKPAAARLARWATGTTLAAGPVPMREFRYDANGRLVPITRDV